MSLTIINSSIAVCKLSKLLNKRRQMIFFFKLRVAAPSGVDRVLNSTREKKINLIRLSRKTGFGSDPWRNNPDPIQFSMLFAI